MRTNMNVDSCGYKSCALQQQQQQQHNVHDPHEKNL